MVSELPTVRVHLCCWTDDPWDVEQSLFSLVAQQGVLPSIHVHRPGPLRPAVESAWSRLAPLAPAGRLEIVEQDPPWPAAEAVAIWVAGTVGTPDLLLRALETLGPGASPVVATMRRVRRRRVPGAPPYVLGKLRRAVPPRITLAELEEDPAFLGRCVFSPAALPGWIPVSEEEHRSWARRVWTAAHPVRVEEPPLVDLPDLRRPAARTRWRDRKADLGYRVPRWLERRVPVAFTHGERWVLRIGRLPGKLRALWRG